MISPIHQRNVKTEPGNNRPISILVMPSKILHDQVPTFINMYS